MKNGDWVGVVDNWGKIYKKGFICDDLAAPKYSIIQTSPAINALGKAKFDVYKQYLVPLESEGIELEQIDELIDLALVTKDEVWFHDLVETKQNYQKQKK